jgi:hypothetical protein
MKRWLKRLAWLVLAVVVVIALVMIAPVGRYVGLAIEDDTLAKAERVRWATPATAPQSHAQVGCLEGTVTLHGAGAPHVAVSAGRSVAPPAICAKCDEGCFCQAAVDARVTTSAYDVVTSDLTGTTTDDQGRFSLCEMPSGQVTVWAEGADGAGDALELRWPSARPVHLELAAPVPFAGRVLDQAGKGIAGANVVVSSSAGGRAQSALTAVGGGFTVKVPPVRSTVLAWAKGYRSAYLDEFFPGTRADAAVIVLPAVWEAFVTVTDDGRPAAGARVRVGRGLWQPADALGVVHFSEISAARMTARAPGRIGSTYFRPLPGVVAHVTIPLSPAFVVRGVVTRDGAPATGVSVAIDDGRTLETDRGGAFESEPLARGLKHLRVSSGACSMALTTRLEQRDVDLEVPLVCPAGVVGRLVTRQGQPLEGATVNAKCGDQATTGTTDPDGRFELATPPFLCALTVSDVRIAPLSARVNSPAKDVVLVGDEGASLHGRLVDEAGLPVRGRTVVVVQELLTEALAENMRGGQGKGWRATAESDGHGAFSIAGLHAARYRVLVGPVEQIGLGFTFSDSIVLPPGQALDVGTLVVRDGVTLHGRITDDVGEPVSGAQLSPNPGRSESEDFRFIAELAGKASLGDYAGAAALVPLSGSSDAFGNYALSNASVIRSLRVMATGFEPRTVEVAGPGALDVALKRVAEVTVHGRVVDHQTGAPLGAFEVGRVTWAQADGRFRQTVPGQGKLEVVAAGYVTRSVPMPPPAGADLDLGDVWLDAVQVLETDVHVVDGDGKAIVNATASARPADSKNVSSASTDVTGMARLSRKPLAGTLTVSAQGFRTAEQPLEADTSSVEIALTGWSRRVQGRALGLDGQPAAGQTVSLGTAKAMVGDDGRFTLEHVADGATELTLDTGDATFGRRIDATATQADVGNVEADATVEFIAASAGAILLRRGAVTADTLEEVSRQPDTGDFVNATVTTPGTWRLAVVAGTWSVVLVPFNERGLTSLFHRLRAAPTVLEVRRGETVRLTLE